jgi:hypothetical protein
MNFESEASWRVKGPNPCGGSTVANLGLQMSSLHDCHGLYYETKRHHIFKVQYLQALKMIQTHLVFITQLPMLAYPQEVLDSATWTNTI